MIHPSLKTVRHLVRIDPAWRSPRYTGSELLTAGDIHAHAGRRELSHPERRRHQPRILIIRSLQRDHCLTYEKNHARIPRTSVFVEETSLRMAIEEKINHGVRLSDQRPGR